MKQRRKRPQAAAVAAHQQQQMKKNWSSFNWIQNDSTNKRADNSMSQTTTKPPSIHHSLTHSLICTPTHKYINTMTIVASQFILTLYRNYMAMRIYINTIVHLIQRNRSSLRILSNESLNTLTNSHAHTHTHTAGTVPYRTAPHRMHLAYYLVLMYNQNRYTWSEVNQFTLHVHPLYSILFRSILLQSICYAVIVLTETTWGQ